MRYYFDFTNGHGLVRDDEGQLLDSPSLVEQEVSRILTDVARDELPATFQGEVKVDVRDEMGAYIYSGSIVFEKHWVTRPS
ncbi:hypothetical protein ASG25_20620 [Rhizobium sp. Leaf384]|uniref:DUF6894 family protein n=1 Tax=Rhizobium sp. Leaf384 TaxID=1736358 RepID=UPI000712EFFB|nr:hypothetical protein [Rhizobium sp. Leaf384]KQS75166.1 hypothetical protein ASG25_20620 [Rhizobium sp. Leaf384]